MTLIERWTITPAHHEDDDEGDRYTVGACIEPPLTFGSEPVEVVRADAYRGAVEAFAQERQAVLDAVNIYGDETLHKALDAIGWPANYIGGQCEGERCPKCGKPSASPPAEVYCVECATEGWQEDAIAHLRHQLAGAERRIEELLAAEAKAWAEAERWKDRAVEAERGQ